MIYEALSVCGAAVVVAPMLVFRRAAVAARADIDRLSHLEKWRRQFHEHATLLIGAEGLPPERLADVRKWGTRISEPAMPGIVLAALGEEASAASSSLAADDVLFQAIRDSAFYTETYVKMMMAFFLAVSFTDDKLGAEIRERLIEAFFDKTKDQAVARVIKFIPQTQEAANDHVDGKIAKAA